jgi:N-acetyl-anhydromuramyl-L-alanine amidase AmpD
VLHDCEGGYEGSVEWFAMNRSNVSAHLVVREDGNEATQMVELADNAWHACAFNRRSVGLEMSGFASRSFNVSLLATAARISAYFCHHLQIPVRHARAGVGPGVVSHHDLGPEGGGRHDPSDDPAFMEAFIAMVHDEYRKGHFPDVWEPRKQQKTCALSPDSSKFARVTSIAQAPPDIHTICGLQQARQMLGYRVTVDGDYGPETRHAITSFQRHAGIVADGIAGAQTEARLSKELKGLQA